MKQKIGLVVCFCNSISRLRKANRALGLTGQTSCKLWVSKCKVNGSFGLVYIYAHTKATGVAIVCNIYRREKESKELKSPL